MQPIKTIEDRPTPELEAVLGKMLGVPLFQQSAMRVAMVCAGLPAPLFQQRSTLRIEISPTTRSPQDN